MPQGCEIDFFDKRHINNHDEVKNENKGQILKCLGVKNELHFKNLEQNQDSYYAAFFLPRKESMRREKQKICGTCKWRRQEVPFGDYYCENPDSDCYSCECMYDDSCIDYEGEE